MGDDTAWLDATGKAALIRKGEVSPAELVGEAIARIEKLNPQLNAVIHELFDRATSEASGTLPDGPFRAVPFLFKALAAELAGTPLSEGLDFSGDYRSTVTQELTQRYIDAGFVVCGKTNAPELGILPTTEPRRFGPSRNPWNTGHSTGGSSGGSAAAVASGMVPAAHANDGGGSIRIPASCCGLVGLKPTRARMRYGPDFGDGLAGLSNEHAVSRSVRDTAAALDATCGGIEGDPYWAPQGPKSYLAAMKEKPKQLRIAFSAKMPGGQELHSDCAAAVRRAAEHCERLGHIVEEAAPDLNQVALTQIFITFWAANVAAGINYIAKITGRTPSDDQFEGLTLGLYEAGCKVTASDYIHAKNRLQGTARTLAKFHRDYDVWLNATLGSTPGKHGRFD